MVLLIQQYGSIEGELMTGVQLLSTRKHMACCPKADLHKVGCSCSVGDRSEILL